MSAVARFVKLPKYALNQLRAIASRSTAPGMPDRYFDFVADHGGDAAEYEWSGYVLATLLVYLQQKYTIDLMKSEYDLLAADLTKARKATHFIFTECHKLALLNGLDPTVLSEQEMADFYNEFNGASEQTVGAAMMEGVIALQTCLMSVDDESVILFSTG